MTAPDVGVILNRIKRGQAILLTDAIAAVESLDAEVADLAAAVAMAEAAQGRLNALVSDRDATIASLHKAIRDGVLHVRRSEFDLAIATLDAALPLLEPTIAQVDRDAAAEYLPLADEECGECERGLMRSGEMDNHWLPRAFARHRLAVRAHLENSHD